MADLKDLSNSKILLVEDASENIDLVLETLGKDFDIIVTTNGTNAIRLAKSEKPDIILLDIVMVGMSGYQVCEILKENKETSSIPIIFLSSMSNSESKKTGFDLGAADYITKPFEKEELKARVNNHLMVKKAQESLHNQTLLLEKKVVERTFELKEAMTKLEISSLEAIYRLSRAAEYRDDDTGNHVFRVGLYSAEIAKQLKLSEETVKRLLLSAPMHDVGKIGISDLILLKPGKLTDEEWIIMKRHAAIGASILEGSSSDIINLAEILARGHHEKWNGKGYPSGKKGEDIPLSCRIVALADVFDAITTERPYKAAFSIEKSFQIVLEEKGEHFDPAVVDAFFEIQSTILLINKKFSNMNKFDSAAFWGMQIH